MAEPLNSLPWFETYAEDYVGDLLEEPGDFCYTIVAIENGAIDGVTGSKSNRICLTENPLIWIPTAFTPNGDDLNDMFPWTPGNDNLGFVSDSIPSSGSVFELTVISRWGDTIFESNDVNDCWNGTSSNGNNVPDGAYTAIVKVLDGSGKWHVITQSVQLHRPQ